MPSSDPLYYSYSIISDKEDKVYATQEDVKGGDQQWDLNPLIFYRLKKPVTDLTMLPPIALGRFFYQNESRARQIFIIVKKKCVTNEQINLAIQNSSQEVQEEIKELQNFTL